MHAHAPVAEKTLQYSSVFLFHLHRKSYFVPRVIGSSMALFVLYGLQFCLWLVMVFGGWI